MVTEKAGEGIDRVITTADYTLGDEDLTFAGTFGHTGIGNALDNTMVGSGGNDVLDGGKGADTLTGGAGADTFRFTMLETSANRDTIKDFSSGSDRIEFDRATFTALAGKAGSTVDPTAFHLGTQATTAEHRIIYDQASGVLSYDADGAGGAAQVQLAVLTNKPTLKASDLFLIGEAVNTAPVATGGDASGDEDTTITGQVGGTDAEGAELTYKLVAPLEGLTFNPDGSYSYAPAKDFNGELTFQYVANDGELNSAPKTVTITVVAVDDVPPVASIMSSSASEADGVLVIPITPSHAPAHDVTLTYELTVRGKTISFDELIEGSLPANYEGVRWTNILSHGDGSALLATAGGQFQSLDPKGFTLTSLTLSSDHLNQLGSQHSVTRHDPWRRRERNSANQRWRRRE